MTWFNKKETLDCYQVTPEVLKELTKLRAEYSSFCSREKSLEYEINSHASYIERQSEEMKRLLRVSAEKDALIVQLNELNKNQGLELISLRRNFMQMFMGEKVE